MKPDSSTLRIMRASITSSIWTSPILGLRGFSILCTLRKLSSEGNGLLIEAEMFEPKEYPHPAGAANAHEGNFFAAQIFRALDVWPGDQIVGIAVGKGRDNFEIATRAESRQRRAVGDAL